MDPRAVRESVAPSVQKAFPPTDRPFSDDMVERSLRDHVEGACELGLYVEAEDQSAPGQLHGRPQAIAFDRDYWTFFQKLTPDFRKALLWLAESFEDRKRQAALVEMVDERLERAVIAKFLRRLKHATIAAVIAGAAGAHWFSDQIAWLVGKLPVLREFWRLITGGGKP